MSAGTSQRHVEAARHRSPRVCKQPDPAVLLREPLEDLPRSILGAAVGEHELEPAVVALVAHRLHGPLDVALLVQHGNEDRAVDPVLIVGWLDGIAHARQKVVNHAGGRRFRMIADYDGREMSPKRC